MSFSCPAKPVANAVTDADLREPCNLMEAFRILRSNDPHYVAITHPSKEQIEDLDAVIKGLRFELDQGVDDASGDETAFELAVALLWHEDKKNIQEGIQLMEYLLKDRWDLRWSTMVGHQSTLSIGLEESLPDDEVGTAGDGGEWVDTGAVDDALADDNNNCGAWTSTKTLTGAAAGSRGVLVGTAIRGATAPPPPEDDGGSAPPSITRERTDTSSLRSRVVASSTPSAGTTASTRDTRVCDATATTSKATKSTLSSYTSPGVCSDVGAACAAVAGPCSELATSEDDAALTRDEQLSKCYYHLAIGYTKLRKNDKALFYAANALQLTPHNGDVLLLKRLLAARLYVIQTLIRSVPFFALGLLFL
jgi:hypothetical protein